MRNIKCADCDEYRNEWCEQVEDSPHPDLVRDCPYWHERKDLVEVVRCKDCVYRDGSICRNNDTMPWSDDDYCSNAERREE